MRYSLFLTATALLFFPTVTQAQYDFDDFLRAVESGQAKTSSPMKGSARLAQNPLASQGTPMADVGELLEVPSLMPGPQATPPSIVPTPEPDSRPVDQEVYGNSTLAQEPLPSNIDFGSLIESQEASVAAPCGEIGVSTGATCESQCQTGCQTARQRDCTVLPYRQPTLPPPSSLHGYFNASPKVVGLWDNYACEVAAQRHGACGGRGCKVQGCGCQTGGRIYECGPAGCR